MKTTAIAPSNIAFVKYWGKRDEVLRLPENNSISMNLSNLLTTTTVDFSSKYEKDDISINGACDLNEKQRIINHIDKLRFIAKKNLRAKIVSVNNFPSGTGLSSSASGFAALSMASARSLGINMSEKELSIFSRQGSGSACRSIPDGFVEWVAGDSDHTSYARSIFPEDYWQILDVVTVVAKEKKEIATTTGQKSANSSIFFPARLANIGKKITQIKHLIKKKDFINFGELIEAEALEMHAVMLTSFPSLIYWQPETLKIMKYVKKWRQEGLEVFFTINTGQDVHLIIESKNKNYLLRKLKNIKEIQKIIINSPAKGARYSTDHLF